MDNIINPTSKKAKVAYSFDAGAHAFLFVHEDMLADVLVYLSQQLKPKHDSYNLKGRKVLEEALKEERQEVFGEYKGTVIAPEQVWVADVGLGAEPVQE